MEDTTGVEAPTADDIVEVGTDVDVDTPVVDDAAVETETEPAGETVVVTIDGVETEVPLEELRSGYLRQSDYTRKTQEIAQQREQYKAFEALQTALQTDPKGTLEALAEVYGIKGADTQDSIEDLDPLELKVRELGEKIERQERAERQARVEQELAAVKQTFSDPDLDEQELLAFAVEKGIVDLNVAYKALRYETAAQATVQKTQQKVEAKRKAPPVEGGAKRPPAAVTPGASKRMSVAEAYRLAMQS